MLFKALAVFLVLYVCATPYFYAKAVKFGMKLVNEPEKAVDEPIFHLPEREETAQKPELTPEQDRMMQILANLERYDGTSKGQKEIKVHG